MAICDGHGLPLTVHMAPASPAEVRLVDATIEDRFLAHWPDRLIGDKAYDSDGLDAHLRDTLGIEMIAPNRAKRCVPQDGRPLRRYKRRWQIERFLRVDPELPPPRHPLGSHTGELPGLPSLGVYPHLGSANVRRGSGRLAGPR